MKKQLILKLIESNDVPKLGDIIKETINGKEYTRILKELFGSALVHKTAKVIKPIVISDEEITSNSMFLNENDEIENASKLSKEDLHIANLSPNCKKIEILPEQFPDSIKQAIVEGILVDGSEIECEYEIEYINRHFSKYIKPLLDSNNKVSITIPEFKEPITYSEEDMFLNMQYYMEHIQSRPNYYITPQDWLKNHKHF